MHWPLIDMLRRQYMLYIYIAMLILMWLWSNVTSILHPDLSSDKEGCNLFEFLYRSQIIYCGWYND